MKTYEKPRLVALSLNGDDRLCGDCANASIKLYLDPSGLDAVTIDEFIAFSTGTTSDGTLTRNELENSNLFGISECADGISGYCKFGSSGEITIAWS